MLSAASCATRSGKLHRRDTVSIDLDSIRARGKLIALTDFNSTNYFLYRGEPMGFQYEMLQALSKHLGVGIEIVTENRIDKAIDMLHTGRADILAMNLAVTRRGKRKSDLLNQSARPGMSWYRENLTDGMKFLPVRLKTALSGNLPDLRAGPSMCRNIPPMHGISDRLQRKPAGHFQ